jgi:hypothetical protein
MHFHALRVFWAEPVENQAEFETDASDLDQV